MLLMIAALGLTACGGGAANTGGAQATTAPAANATGSTAAPAPAGASGGAGNSEILISLNADPPKLDPAQSSAFVDRQVLNNICDKLVDIDAQGKIMPMLATAWKISDDKLSYTFTLREGVQFHDRTDFNADAVKANLARDMTEKSPRRTELSSVQSVDVVDPKTVKITLSMAAGVLAEAGLSFLGLGAQPPTPSWGQMLSVAQGYISLAPWLAYWPGLAIFLAVMGFNLIGDGVREALDPRLL